MSETKKVIVCIADGSEEIETVSVIDVLRRASIDVTVARVYPDSSTKVDTSLQITARSQTKIIADVHWADLVREYGADRIHDHFSCIVLPGGLKGAETFADCKDLIVALEQFKQHSIYAAICAAPAIVLTPHKLLEGKTLATCFPKMHDKLPAFIDATSKYSRVVVDGNLITSQGPATSIDFALYIVEKLLGAEKAHEIGEALLAC